MKNIFYLLVLLFAIEANAQIKFENLSLNDAVKKASTTGKIVFAQFVSATCDECNEVADIALSKQELADAVAKKFIALKIELSHQDRESFIEKYNPAQSLGSFFISGDGELVHRYPATTTMHTKYLNHFDSAYSKLTEGKATLAELNSEWNSNPLNVTAMEVNMERRSSLALSTDSLLEVYVDRLPSDSFNSIRILYFIARQAPSLFSKANLFLRKNKDLFTMVWYSMPSQQRITINNKIAYKSLANAIAEKNRRKALAVANFHAGTHTDRNSNAAQKTFNKKMLDYFVGVKDTPAYLKQAVIYYEEFYINETNEQIQMLDSLAKNKALQNAKSETITTTDQSKGVVSKSSFSYAPVTQFFSNDLMRGARLLYTSTSDKTYMEKALAWAKRANEVHETPDAMDTYARLLYKAGDKVKAIELEQKAMDFSKARKLSFKRFEAVLSKMKAGETIID